MTNQISFLDFRMCDGDFVFLGMLLDPQSLLGKNAEICRDCTGVGGGGAQTGPGLSVMQVDFKLETSLEEAKK